MLQKQPLLMHVVHSLDLGGTERVLCRLTLALAKHGRRQMVCTLGPPGSLAASLDPAVELVSLNSRSPNRRLAWRLAGVLRRAQPRIVHARNWGVWTDTVLAVRFAGRGRALLGHHGRQTTAGFTACDRRRARWLGMTACPAATVSDAAARQLCDQLGFDGSRVAVIPNGVDLEEFAPRNVARRRQARSLLNLAEEDFLIGTVGSLTPVKGHSVLFAAFARLAAGLGNAKLVLIGDGPLRTMLAEQAQQLGIASRVVFAGSWRDVSRVLPALDLYVSSSLAEGCSNAVLEAMATALPCVVTDVSDQGRLVAGVDPGLVVPSGDVAALGRILEYLATRRDRAVEIGRRHRLLIEDRYDFTRTVAEYESLYDRLIKGPTPAGGICDERTE